jgi:hypothetical protein
VQGVKRGYKALQSLVVFAPSDLEKAAKAGALCEVVIDYSCRLSALRKAQFSGQVEEDTLQPKLRFGKSGS